MKQLIVDEKVIRKRMVDLDVRNISELASKSGVSKPTIYDYMNGKTPLSVAFVRLCEYLELNPDELLVEADDITEGKNV
ncbi:MAG: helix-turn-helix transcriptional regulator [Lachnospiraceae bacterium]|nr:helix-turn-helix transcriptional regulator [Lachnospiraceae bacterium]